MPFRTLLDYFDKNAEANSEIVIENNFKKKTKPIDHNPENDRDFLSNFYIPKSKPAKSQSFNHKSEPKISAPMEEEGSSGPNKILLVYTDGSCILNGKPNARGGWAVYFPGGEYPNMAEKFTRHPTNQRCELTAIWRALETIKPYLDEGGRAEIYTDSEYSIKCITEYCKKWSVNGWVKADKNPIENRDIIEPLYGLYTTLWRNLAIKHIRAHTGNKDKHSVANDIVDQMARSTISA